MGEVSAGTVWLVGMMGAGKSAVGRALAARLGRPFADSDAEVERAAGRPLADLFASAGEAGFRELERRAIEELAGRPLVVALGGGAIAQPGAARRLAETGTVIYLKARPETLLARVGEAECRPLLRGLDRAGRLARLRALLAERRAAYETAQLVVETDDLDVAGVADALAGRL